MNLTASLLSLALAVKDDPPRRYQVVPEKSFVEFRLGGGPTELHGFSHALHGELVLPRGFDQAPGERALEGVLSVELEATSFQMRDPARSAELGKKLLETRKHPRIRFVAARLEADLAPLETGGWVKVLAGGELELHGVKRELNLPAACIFPGSRISCDIEFSLSAADFGLKIPRGWKTPRDAPFKVHVRFTAQRIPWSDPAVLFATPAPTPDSAPAQDHPTPPGKVWDHP